MCQNNERYYPKSVQEEIQSFKPLLLLYIHLFFFSLPHEVLAICKVKEIPSFLSCFEALCIGLAPWIEPATTRSAVKRSTDRTSLAAVKTLYPLNKSKCNERPTYIRECVGEILNRSLSSSHTKKTKLVNNNNLKKHSHYLPSRLPW